MKRKKLWVPVVNEVDCVSDNWEAGTLAPAEVLVRNLCSHISAGTELACIAGEESFFSIPDTPGYTAVGQIEALGAAVQGFEKGDRVYTYGPHAAYFKIDTTDRWHGVCVPVPEGVTNETAAFTHMATIALTAIRQSTIELGDRVLVTGLGAIGNLAAQLAQLQGAEVLALDRIPGRVAAAKASGIAGAEVVGPGPVPESLRQKLTDQPIQVFIDATGAAAVLEAYVPLLGPSAQVIVLGSPRRPYQTNLTGFLQHFHLLPLNAELRGALEFIYPTYPSPFHKHSITRNAEIILDLMLQKRLHTEPLLTQVLKPENAAEGYQGLRERPQDYLGVLIDWTQKPDQ
ncbi:zinc-binding dehydrogenase [Phaeodactylibacter xiamenensis]|uniref:zinc-binding dehydrogenase n=1 Tax=Phaeodactylibacter xiamenensis TaxID=1524460 RepID=UPI0024A8ECD0|nr:zinc-binding dehydrogenase [Phaeodactylibacter xiamenensis]